MSVSVKGWANKHVFQKARMARPDSRAEGTNKRTRAGAVLKGIYAHSRAKPRGQLTRQNPAKRQRLRFQSFGGQHGHGRCVLEACAAGGKGRPRSAATLEMTLLGLCIPCLQPSSGHAPSHLTKNRRQTHFHPPQYMDRRNLRLRPSSVWGQCHAKESGPGVRIHIHACGAINNWIERCRKAL